MLRKARKEQVMRKTREVGERFWEKVDKGEKDECWEWNAHRYPTGYGSFYFRGKPTQAHRVAYMLSVGDIPANHYICHTCDNPACCNPDHLFLGTPSDNYWDMVDKNRINQANGVRIGTAKLDEDKVRKVRKMRESGMYLREIGAEFGVTGETVRTVCNGKFWNHIV
jgi:hypothetical protein